VWAYALGNILSLFYYAGVLGDMDEARNIRKWHSRGVPLARFLHTTHSTSFFTVNIDLLFKEPTLVCKFLPASSEFYVWAMLAYSTYYTSWVMLNYTQTKHFPYPFMNQMGGWQLPLLVLLLLAVVSMFLVALAAAWISWLMCERRLGFEGLLPSLLGTAREVLGGAVARLSSE
jgi:hypothetical protein